MRSIAIAASFILMAACGGLPALPAGEEIAIVPGREPDTPRTGVSNERVGQYSGTGAGVGAAGGALTGLICGPFAPICVPGFLVLGGMAGTGAGAVVGMAAGVSTDTRNQLLSRLETFKGQHNPRADLLLFISQRAKERWKIVEAPAKKSLGVHVGEVSFNSSGEDRVSLSVWALISITTLEIDGYASVREKWFHYAGAPVPASLWLDDKGGFVQTSFNLAYETLAQRVVAELEAR
jgi:hypothetical protein